MRLMPFFYFPPACSSLKIHPYKLLKVGERLFGEGYSMFDYRIYHFGYCQISLNAEKIIIVQIFFYKSRVLTRLCCNLAICDKITRFVAFFLIDDLCRLPFQSLKSNKINFSLSQHVVQKVPLDLRKPF